MALLVNFIIGLVATAVDAVATEAQLPASIAAINQIVIDLPGDIGVAIVGLLTGMAGLMTAVGNLF